MIPDDVANAILFAAVIAIGFLIATVSNLESTVRKLESDVDSLQIKLRPPTRYDDWPRS